MHVYFFVWVYIFFHNMAFDLVYMDSKIFKIERRTSRFFFQWVDTNF